MQISDLISSKRLELGYNQSDIAKKLGITRQQYSQWELDQAPVPEKYYQQLCKILHLKEQEFRNALTLDFIENVKSAFRNN